MTATNGWPDKPGVPQNPERDGWHWLETPDGERVPYEWRSAGECERGRWPSYWVSQGEDCWEAPACKYLGPVLTPDEAAALQMRVANLEAALAALQRDASQEIATDEMVRRLQHLGDWQAADRVAALQKRVAELEAQNDMLRHATDKLRAMLAELNARHEPLQRAFITAVELLNDAALEGGKDE